MLDDLTLREVFHIRVSVFGAITVISVMVLLLLGLLSLLIVLTPIRNILPGYSASVRQEVIVESQRVDSLQIRLDLQKQYMESVKQVLAGTISADSVPSLDSMQLLEPVHPEEIRSNVMDEFMAQYEQKEHDRLLLFDNSANRTIYQAYRPVHGVVIESAAPEMNRYGVVIRTTDKENLLAAMRGAVISVERMVDDTYELVLQSGSLLIIYRHVPKIVKMPGSHVEKGEVIGMMDGVHKLVLEMWDAGEFVNPEEVIVW